MEEKPVCAICNRIRFIVVCVIIAAFVAYRPEFNFLKDYDIRHFAWLVLICVTALFFWKGYHEFWKNK
tara:strand:+ start:355 stop:558 length:204 start_codon:yes stop_codon:yes gene_type:complete